MVKKILIITLWCLWVTACYFVSQLIVTGIFSQFGLLGTGDVFTNTILTALVYIVMLGTSFLGVYPKIVAIDKFYKGPKFKECFTKVTAMARRINWKDLGQALTYVLLYFCALIVVMIVFQLLFPELAGEEQSVGFAKEGNNWWQLSLIFVALVIVAPVAEELIMRGLLFGQIRSRIPFWPTAIIVSLLFAVAHGQINVGIDTFILSLFLCFVREKTGAIYAPILMHVMKNLVGFLTVFVFVL